MKGDRGARGLVHRNKKLVDGENYTGDPTAVIAPWGGGAGAAPAAGIRPVLTLARDDDDDGDATAIISALSKRGTAALRRAIASTKTKTRTQFQTIANHIAWLMEGAAGTRSLKALVLDGVGGAPTVPLPGGSLQTSGDAQIGGNLTVGGHVVGDLTNTGKFHSQTGRQRQLLVGPGAWQPIANMDLSNVGKLKASAGPAQARLAIPIPVATDGTAVVTLDAVQLYLVKTTAGLATAELDACDRSSAASTMLANTSDGTNGATILNLVPAPVHTMDANSFLTVSIILPAAGDYLVGTLVEYTTNLF